MEAKDGLTRRVVMTPAWDKSDPNPHKDCGVSGVDIHFVLRGDEGCIVFILMTSWMLPHVHERYRQQGLSEYQRPYPAYLCYHSYEFRPAYDGKHSKTCEYLDNRPAFCGNIGDCRSPDPLFAALVKEGDEGVWKLLEARYQEVFGALQTSPEPSPPSILKPGNMPPMNFQDAKAVLFPHITTPGYLQQALLELEALPVTKAIKKASEAHLRKAAQHFVTLEREKRRGEGP